MVQAYGSSILAEYAKKVIGIDIDLKPFNYAIKTYKKPNLTFKLIKSDTYPLEFEDEQFDVILLKHVIEHIVNVRRYINELKRILKKDGYVIIITPNRKLRLMPFQKPFHNDHVKEYTYKSFKKELESFFKNVDIKGIYGIKEINKIEKSIRISSKNPFIAYINNRLLSSLSKILTNNIKSTFLEIKQKQIS